MPSLRVSRNPVVGLGVFLVVIIAAYKSAEAILANDTTSLLYSSTRLHRFSRHRRTSC